MTAKSEPQIFVVGAELTPLADGGSRSTRAQSSKRVARQGRARRLQPRSIQARPFVFEVARSRLRDPVGRVPQPGRPAPRVRRHLVRLDAGARRARTRTSASGRTTRRRWMRSRAPASTASCSTSTSRAGRSRSRKPVLLQHGKVIIRATPVAGAGRAVRALHRPPARGDLARDGHARRWSACAYQEAGRDEKSRATPRRCASAAATSPPSRSMASTEERSTTTPSSSAPLPASGAIPIEQQDFDRRVPAVDGDRPASIEAAVHSAVAATSPWLTFRTLRRRYDKQLRFATGSCRWYPGDTNYKRESAGSRHARGPRQLADAAPRRSSGRTSSSSAATRSTPTRSASATARSSRARGSPRACPARPIPVPLRDKLVDGAWAGRFAHRFMAYKDPDPKLAGRIDQEGLEKLDEIHKQHPDLKDIYEHYPDVDRRKALKTRHDDAQDQQDVSWAAQHDRGGRRAPGPPDGQGARPASRRSRSSPSRSGPRASTGTPRRGPRHGATRCRRTISSTTSRCGRSRDFERGLPTV